MASFLNINENLTAVHARQVGAGASFMVATYLLAGQPTRPVSMGLQEVVNEETGKKMWVKSRIGSLLDHEDIAEDVMNHEKAALLAKKVGGAIITGMKNNQGKDLERRERANADRAAQGLPTIDPEGGLPYEWDHWAFTLSPDETAWLKANPDREADFHAIVSLGMIRHPMADGVRQALITPIHKDTGDWHVQGLVSRFAIDVSGPKPVVPPAVEVSTSSHMSKLVAMMQAEFDAAGMPISINKADLGLASKRGLFESRATTDAAKEAYIQAVQGAGGIPGARTTVGPIPGPQASATAIADLIPEVGMLERGKSLATDDGLKMAQRMQQLTAEMEATRTAMEAAAAREATFDAAIAAIGQKAAAEAAREAAEVKATQEAHLRELAEQEVARAAAKVVEAERLAIEAREHADTLAGELRTAGELAQGEPRRIEEAVSNAVAPVSAELNDVRGNLMRAEKHVEEMEKRADALDDEFEAVKAQAAGEQQRTNAAVDAAIEPLRIALEAEKIARTVADQALIAEKDSFIDRARAWAAEHIAGPLIARAEVAETALKAATEQITGFPDRMEAELTRRLEAMETRLQASFDRMMERAQNGFNKALAVKDRIIDSLRATRPTAPPEAEPDAPAPEIPPKPRGGGGQDSGSQGGGSAPAVPATSTPSSGLGTGRPKGSRRGKDFFMVESGKWTDDHKAAARESLEDNQAKKQAMEFDKDNSGDVTRFGDALRDKWLAQQAENAAKKEVGTPTREPGRGLKPK